MSRAFDGHGAAGAAGDRARPSSDVLAVAGALASWRAESSGVTVVAIDGHGAAGKSTLARHLSTTIALSLVHTDDFFRPVTRLESREPSLGEYYDTGRLRSEALGPLRSGNQGFYRCFDWNSASLGPARKLVPAGELVVVEGVYSAAPELADLVDKAIYVDTPEPERLRRLRVLVTPENWDDEWLRAETAYFARVRPPESFDLVFTGAVLGS